MTDSRQRTQWALDLFDGFIRKWTPPAMHEELQGRWCLGRQESDGEIVRKAIRAVAPVEVSGVVG